MINRIIEDYLKNNNYSLSPNPDTGLKLSLNSNELVIRGNDRTLIEFADYIVSIAISNKKNDHLHLDNLTLVDDNSEIQSIVIEKNNP